MRNLLLIFLGMSLLLSCRTGKEADASAVPRQIVFGQGGGFSGKITAHVLYEDGRIMVLPLQGDPTELVTTLSKKETKKLFKRTEEWKSLKLNQPGNMYTFIELVEGENRYKITWGNSGSEVPEAALLFYKDLAAKLQVEM